MANVFDIKELPGSPTLSYTRETIKGKRIIKVPWAQLDDMVNDFFGLTVVSGAQITQTGVIQILGILRTNPITWPSINYLILDSIEIQPFDDVAATYNNAGVPVHDFARVTLGYTTYPYDTQNDKNEDDPDAPKGTYLTHTFTAGGEFLLLPSSGFKWETGNAKLPDDVPVGMMVPSEEHTFTWKSVPNPPFKSITNMVGKVNDAKFSGKDMGTCLFLGATASREITVDGTRTWTLEYKISVKIIKWSGGTAGWNDFFNPETGKWDKIVNQNDDYVYQDDDMGSLFRLNAQAV